MQGCSFKAETYRSEPFTIVSEDSSMNKCYNVLEVSNVETVAERRNFTVEYVLNEDGALWGEIKKRNSTGLMRLIQNIFVDLGFGTLRVTSDRSLYLKRVCLILLTNLLLLCQGEGCLRCLKS